MWEIINVLVFWLQTSKRRNFNKVGTERKILWSPLDAHGGLTLWCCFKGHRWRQSIFNIFVIDCDVLLHCQTFHEHELLFILTRCAPSCRHKYSIAVCVYTRLLTSWGWCCLNLWSVDRNKLQKGGALAPTSDCQDVNINHMYNLFLYIVVFFNCHSSSSFFGRHFHNAFCYIGKNLQRSTQNIFMGASSGCSHCKCKYRRISKCRFILRWK